MEIAGNDALEKDVDVGRKGLGTPATRAGMTAKWEMELSDIAQGKSSKEEFLKDIENEIKEAVMTYSK